MIGRLRIICFSSFVILIILSLYIIWPWFHAASIWRQSTIKSLNFSTTSLLSNTDSQVPRIIHQTYRDIYSIPFKWQQASNSCRELHSNYKYYLWTDKEARRLIEKEFPCILSTFDSYPYDIQRADVIRLVALYVYGGIYLDFDIICLKSLDKLLNYEFVLPLTKPVGLSNDFIVSKPKHPFLLKVLNDLPKFNRNFLTKYPTVMFSTGPMFLTQEASSYPNRSSLDTLSPVLYGKYAYNSSYSLFRHIKASSWHGNDASMIKYIYRWRHVFIVVLIIILIMIFVIIYVIQQYHTILKMIYQIYLSIVLNLNHTKQKEQTFTHRKYIRLLLLNFVLFYFSILALYKVIYPSFIDHDNISS
ncbi:unnamed protein product [Rotaria sordida]|nr:unnamed protein product [Rotaria sordida]CAF0956573.1 unnamed protein product [Rotaria sordida]CAF0986791.1 unnamed protein product [Rotaria sordida]CAF1025382.1 unnamed protein product [Rotaria sordida]CAF1060848.1 unnamed protein product [Rotaria sordida]